MSPPAFALARPLLPLTASSSSLRRARHHRSISPLYATHRSPNPPPPPSRPPRRRTRVPRAQSSAAPDWQWQGASAGSMGPRADTSVGWPALLSVLRAVSAAPLLLRVARVLRSVTSAVARALAASASASSTSLSSSSSSSPSSSSSAPFSAVQYEYGLVEPDEGDAFFVDPLVDWEVGADPSYRDSRGHAVHLHVTTAASGLVLAADFRDGFDFDERSEPEERLQQSAQPQHRNDSSPSSSTQSNSSELGT